MDKSKIKTTSLELSKQMKSLGFPQESAYYYGYNPIDPNKEMALLLMVVKPNALEWYAAPTAEEVLEQLPDRIDNCQLEVTRHDYEGKKVPHLWNVMYNQTHHVCEKPSQIAWYNDESLAEAAGKMYVFLKENDKSDL